MLSAVNPFKRSAFKPFQQQASSSAQKTPLMFGILYKFTKEERAPQGRDWSVYDTIIHELSNLKADHRVFPDEAYQFINTGKPNEEKMVLVGINI